MWLQLPGIKNTPTMDTDMNKHNKHCDTTMRTLRFPEFLCWIMVAYSPIDLCIINGFGPFSCTDCNLRSVLSYWTPHECAKCLVQMVLAAANPTALLLPIHSFFLGQKGKLHQTSYRCVGIRVHHSGQQPGCSVAMMNEERD